MITLSIVEVVELMCAIATVKEIVLVVVELPCWWICKHIRGAMMMIEMHRDNSRGKGVDAEVNAVRTTIDEMR